MITPPSRLTSSTGCSCFLTSAIAVQVPRLFLFHGDSTPASALLILSSRELLAQFFEVPIYKNVSIGYSLTKILSIQRSTGYKRKEIATSAEFNII